MPDAQHSLTLSNEAAWLLGLMLSNPEPFKTTQDKFQAGALIEEHFEGFIRPANADAAWMNDEWKVLPLTERQREVCKTAVKWGCDKFNGGRPMNSLIKQLGLHE